MPRDQFLGANVQVQLDIVRFKGIDGEDRTEAGAEQFTGRLRGGYGGIEWGLHDA